MGLTPGVDYELPGATTNNHRGDVANVFVCDRTRANVGSVADGLDAIDDIDARLAFGNDVLDRCNGGHVFQRQNCRPGFKLNRGC